MSEGGPVPATPSRGASNLQLRVVSAVVLIVLTIALAWAGGIWFRIWCAAIAVGVLYEWTAMMPTKAGADHRTVLYVLMGLLVMGLLAGLSTTSLLAALVAVVVAGGAHAAWSGAGLWPVAGLAYAGLSAVALALIRGADTAGLVAILFLFAIVWATDIFAYFVGKAVGGPKLAPSISPGKTRSGAVGGAVAGVIGGVSVAILAGSAMGLATVALVALLLSIVSQAGDLFESALKRRFQVKDSSKLIPGHGGVMDRVDGLVAAAAAMLVIGIITGADMPAHAFFDR